MHVEFLGPNFQAQGIFHTLYLCLMQWPHFSYISDRSKTLSDQIISLKKKICKMLSKGFS